MEKLYRQVKFDRASIRDNTIELSFVSESPYYRSHLNGYEVLDLQRADFSFINSGNAPFLLDHRSDDHQYQIGVVEKAWIDNGQGRAIVRFSTDPAKQGVINDIKDGIRTNISVGYSITEGKKLERTIDGKSVYSFSFSPFEVSSVNIPADTEVGTNRSDEPENVLFEKNINTKEQSIDSSIDNQKTISTKGLDTMENSENKTIDTDAQVRAAVEASQKRSLEIMKLCDDYKVSERAQEFIKSGFDMVDVKLEVIKAVEQRSKDLGSVASLTDVTRFNQAPAVHTRKQEPYNVALALRSAASNDWSEAGLEREMSQEHSRGLARSWSPNSFAFSQKQVRADAISTVGTAGDVGNLVGTQYRPDMIVDPRWASTILDKLPTTKMTGLSNNQSLPIVTSKATAKMVTETGALGDAEKVTTDIKTLTPKEMITKSAFSRQSLVQTDPNVQNIVYKQLYQAIAEKLDTMAFAATTGVGDLPSLLAAITGGQLVAGGTNGLAPTRTNLLKLFNILGKANVTDFQVATNTSVATTLANTLNDSANTASNYIIPALSNQNMLLGRSLYQSNNIPSNLTKGTASGICSPIVVGDFSDFVVGSWDTVQVVVDQFTGADNSVIIVRSYSFYDFIIRRLESFVATKDLLTL